MIELEDYSNALGTDNKKSTNVTISKATRRNQPPTPQPSNSNHVASENGLPSPTVKSLKNKTNTLDYEQQLNLLNSYKNAKKATTATAASPTSSPSANYSGSYSVLPQTSLQTEINTGGPGTHQSRTHNFDETMASKSSKKSLSNDSHTQNQVWVIIFYNAKLIKPLIRH